MFGLILGKIFGTKHERDVKRMRPAVAAINALEPAMQELSDPALRGKTEELRQRLADGEELEALLPEAFAACREAARRTVQMRHFDVQLMGGMVLHEGKIAEMATGEGKTLVATLAAYLNALPGLGTHVVTVNDYLARRDAQWMGPIYHALGLTVGVIQHEVQYLYDPTYASPDIRLAGLRPCTRREAYHADITYGTNNEFGFDYLRDNMRFSLEEMVQREHHYAIVDEVDSILIDEARTPLIISGRDESAENKAPLYEQVDRVIPRLKRAATIVEGKLSEIEEQAEGDFIVDEKAKTVSLTEQGVAHCERLLGVDNLSDPANMEVAHLVHQALKAHHIFSKDVDYVVKEMETVDDAGRPVVQPQVIIVDEFTGRLMPGRRWSDGLHEAVEAKERIRIARENQTLATITIQNYFRMYAKLAGMTGTADTEAVEFKNIYKLDVVVMPPNKEMRRIDYPDVVYKTEREKLAAPRMETSKDCWVQGVVGESKDCHERGQPVLVGTTSVEKSERVSKLLKKDGIKHNVLNAINHEAEANIIAQAGRYKQVTIATNMAGRGTDILLGGNPEFLARSEMENEWIRRAGSFEGGGDNTHERYEDALRSLHDRYREETQGAGEQFQKELADLEERRGEALRELTEAHRQILELSPYRAPRSRFEEVSSVELIPAVRDHDPVPPRYQRVMRELETALLDAGGGGAVATERENLEALRARYAAVLDAWDEAGHRTDDTARELDERRSEYERGLSTFELALPVKGGVGGNGDLGEYCWRYRAAEELYAEAGRVHEAH